MQRLIFDYSPVYFLLCAALGVGYAWLLYTAKYTWGKTLNRILFSLRALLASALLILLLGPVLRQTTNIFEQPTLVFLIDNSRSIKERTDTAKLLTGLRVEAGKLKNFDWSIEWSTLDGVSDSIQFNHRSSDLSSALKETTNRFEGRNLAGIILVSDGIYNNGVSPLYQPLRVPVHVVGVGDTTQRADLVMKNVAYNRVVYQGNKYPLRAEVGVSGLPDVDITVRVRHQGKVIHQLTKNAEGKTLLDFDFQLDAGAQGIQRLEIQIDQHPREINIANNRSTAFIEIVEGKKKILAIASSPHPDLKALRTVVEKNSNYEFLVHLAGIRELPAATLAGQDIDLVIAHQSPDQEGMTTSLLTNLLRAKVPALIIIGDRTKLQALPASGVPITFEPSGQRDEVQPVLNPGFQDLGFSTNLSTLVGRYPPVNVPFGKFTLPMSVKPILYQRIGNLVTERPLLFLADQESHKIGVLVGDGIWKWRLSEFQETGKTIGFDELLSKVLQYLSTKDDRRKFRSFPLQQEFASDGPVVMESQVFNDLFEPIYGNTIEIELLNEEGKASVYHYVTGPGSSSRYRVAGLKEGIYRYTSSTELKGKRETAKGEFLVVEQSQESRNLTADFSLLRKLSAGTAGKFYRDNELAELSKDLAVNKAQTTIHSEENFNPLINLKWVFFLLLLLISVEWFLRKFAGSY